MLNFRDSPNEERWRSGRFCDPIFSQSFWFPTFPSILSPLKSDIHFLDHLTAVSHSNEAGVFVKLANNQPSFDDRCTPWWGHWSDEDNPANPSRLASFGGNDHIAWLGCDYQRGQTVKVMTTTDAWTTRFPLGYVDGLPGNSAFYSLVIADEPPSLVYQYAIAALSSDPAIGNEVDPHIGYVLCTGQNSGVYFYHSTDISGRWDLVPGLELPPIVYNLQIARCKAPGGPVPTNTCDRVFFLGTDLTNPSAPEIFFRSAYYDYSVSHQNKWDTFAVDLLEGFGS